jgi:short-subunit dehydrogenase
MNSPNNRKKIAIITGASAGLGYEFAKQIEKSFYLDEIWLVARRAAPMKELAESFQKSKGVILSLNLSSDSDLAQLKKKLDDENPQVEILVNNAGLGKVGPFLELGLEEQLEMVNLNVRSLTYLTHCCLPFMFPGAKILQVASSIGFAPAPYFAVYAATKAFVVSLSEALSFELRSRGISVTAVCPGPVATEFFEVSQRNQFLKDRVAPSEPVNRKFMATAEEVVTKALNDAEKGNRRSIFGFPMKSFVRLAPFIPRSLLLKLLSRRYA